MAPPTVHKVIEVAKLAFSFVPPAWVETFEAIVHQVVVGEIPHAHGFSNSSF